MDEIHLKALDVVDMPLQHIMDMVDAFRVADCGGCQSNLGIKEKWTFCPGRGMLDQLYVLAGILEGAWEFTWPAYMFLMDLEKAYQCVLCSVLSFMNRISRHSQVVVVSAFCRWCGHIGFIKQHPEVCTGTVCTWVWSGWELGSASLNVRPWIQTGTGWIAHFMWGKRCCPKLRSWRRSRRLTDRLGWCLHWR